MWDSAVLSAFLLSPSAISHFNVFLVQKRKSEVGSKKPTNLLSWYQPEIILNPTNEIILMKLNREFSHFRNKNGSTKRCYVLQARTRAVTGPHCDTWSIARYNSTWHDWDKFELKTVKLSVDSKTKPARPWQAMSALRIWAVSWTVIRQALRRVIFLWCVKRNLLSLWHPFLCFLVSNWPLELFENMFKIVLDK